MIKIKIIYFVKKLKLLINSQILSTETISKKEAGNKYLLEGWKNELIPERQWVIVKEELKQFKKTGIGTRAYQAAIDMIKTSGLKSPSVLEVGCSSGYYSEVFKIAGLSIKYTGCDYSNSFIEMAKEKYPSTKFIVSDATKLSFESRSFDIVLLGGVLVHIKDWEKAIKEATRVSKGTIILHRMPIINIASTHFYRKKGYGIDVMEIAFNEEELFNVLRNMGLGVIGVKSYDLRLTKDLDEEVRDKTYLVQKMKNI